MNRSKTERVNRRSPICAPLHSAIRWFCFFAFACVFGINLWAQSADTHRNKNVDSLEMILTAHPPTGADLLRIYSDLSSYYTTNYNPEKNRELALKGIDLARKLNNPYETALLYNNLGSAYDDLSQYDSAMVYYEIALDLIETMESKKQESTQNIGYLLGLTYSNMGNLYNVQSLFDKAIENYLKAIVLFEKLNVPNRLSNVFRNISLVYTNMKNYKQAEYYLNKGVEINTVLQDSLALASTLTRLGHVYSNQLKFSEALQCAEQADKIYAQHIEKRDLRIYNLRVLSAIWYNGFKDEQKAMKYAQIALEESKKMGIKLEISRSLQVIASLHIEYKQYAQAERTAMEAFQADSSNLTNNILLYESLTLAHAGLGNTTQAHDYFELYKTATTTYSNQNFQSSLSEMEVRYETEKKEMRIAAFEDEKRLMTRFSLAVAAVLLLALSASLLLWWSTVQKKRLAEKQKQLAEQQVIQLEQEKQLIATQAVLDGETTERTRIARDLHDGLGSMLSVVRLNLDAMKGNTTLGTDESIRFNKAITLLDDSIEEMRRVAHHLMPDALSRFGLKTALTDFLNVVPTVEFNYFGEAERLDRKMEVVIYRIIHELVTNALKHASASHILVQVIHETNRIALTVEDNGCGFDPAVMTDGAGIRNIRTRVDSFGGLMDMRSVKGAGTEINIEFLY